MTIYHVVLGLAALGLAAFCISHGQACQTMEKDVMFIVGTTLGGIFGHAGSRVHYQGTTKKTEGNSETLSQMRASETER